MEAIQILVVDLRALVGRGVSMLLNSYPDFQVIGYMQSGQEALSQVELQPVDVLRHASPYARIVVLTNEWEDATIMKHCMQGPSVTC